MSNPKIQFQIHTQDENGNYPVTATLPETFIESINVESSCQVELTEVGAKPIVLPLGCDSRSCSITGSFEGSMIGSCPGEATGPGAFITDENLLAGIASNNPLLGKAISVKVGHEFVPELGNRKWKITTFQWNREARTRGLYKFQMELGYVWENKQELQLFSTGVGINIVDHVDFTVEKMPSGTKVPVTTLKIRKSLNDINFATISVMATGTTSVFSQNDPIKIMCKADTSVPAFIGIIKELRSNKNGIETYECKEIGQLLYEINIIHRGQGLFLPKVKIANPYNRVQYLTIAEILKKITSYFKGHKAYPSYDCGVGIDKTGKLAGSKFVPGMDGSDGSIPVYLPPQVISGMSVGKAVDAFLQDQCGLHTWFNPTNGALEYGYWNNKITINPAKEYILSSTPVSNNNDQRVPDYVIVWNANDVSWAVYGEKEDEKAVGISYKLSTSFTNMALELVAKKIYTDLRLSQDQYTVEFPAGTIRFQEGDVFQGLGDQVAVPHMEWRPGDANPYEEIGDTSWKINDIVITEKSTSVTVGPSYRSIFDIYKQKLSPVDGVPATVEEMTWNSISILSSNTTTSQVTV